MTDSRFVWVEWMGANPAQAADFYSHVVGWDISRMDIAFPYWIGSAAGAGTAGLFQTPPEAHGAPPCWTGYVRVESVDAAIETLKAAGGRAMRPPFDIPGVGRMAIVADPQGAPFALFREASGSPPAAAPEMTPGSVGWRELHAADSKTAFDFYAKEFGWLEARLHDMGPMGTYRIWAAGAQEGGMMTKMANGPGPCWVYYFAVATADAANARVAEKGGKVVNGPHQVPGGLFASQCVDAEGALFGLVAPSR